MSLRGRPEADVAIRILSLPPWGRWHGAAVTDEGLASPYGRGAPGRGGEGDFYLLSHFVTAHPEWEPRGMRIVTGGNPQRGPRQCAHYSALRAGFAGCALYTPAGVVARNDSNCRNALQERYRAVPNRITNTDQPCTHCQRRLAAEFFQIPIDKVGYRCYTANTYQTGE